MIPLLGFAPDADPTTPGMLTDCTNLIPSERGMTGAPAPVNIVGVGPLADVCRGAAIIANTAGTRRTFAGTRTKLYELSGTNWIDVSRVGPPADYVGSTENRWIFAQFGNAALATNDSEKIQATLSGAFADIATAPSARIIVSTRDFVLAFNTNDASFGDSPDRWWCSAFQNHADWAISATTQATSGRLIGNGGEITAAVRFGEYVAAFKETSMFLGRYVGPPIVFQWDQVPGDVGCVGPEALVDIGGAVVFVGHDNIWLFAGDRPAPIATGLVAQWFLNNSSATYRYRTQVSYDKQNRRIWIFFPSAASADGTIDSSLVYHLDTKRWGRANRVVEAIFNHIGPGLTWDTFNTISTTWDGLPNVPWDSQSFQAGGRSFAIFNTAHQVQTMTGGSTSSGLTTGDFGDDDGVTTVRQVRARFLTAPTSAQCTGYTKMAEGDPLLTQGTTNLADGKFDQLQTARWHRFSLNFVGAHEITAVRVPLTARGGR